MVVDGDVAVVQQRLQATAKATGQAYDNQYCWVYVFRDGRIVEIEEYADTIVAGKAMGWLGSGLTRCGPSRWVSSTAALAAKSECGRDVCMLRLVFPPRGRPQPVQRPGGAPAPRCVAKPAARHSGSGFRSGESASIRHYATGFVVGRRRRRAAGARAVAVDHGRCPRPAGVGSPAKGGDMTTIDLSAVQDASAWSGEELRHDRGWRLELDDGERAELDRAVDGVRSRGLVLAEIDAATFPLPGLAPKLALIAEQLRHGRGFAVLGGFPVEDRPLEDVERAYWGLCSHLGTGITQNSDATLIHYVTEGRLRPNQGTRGVGFPTESTLHVDLTDVASLLCVRQAPDDPPSWLASSTRVFNELLAQHPAALEPLLEGFQWDRMDEHGPGEAPTTGYRVPVFSVADGTVSCRYNRYWMASAHRRLGTQHTEAQRLALDLFDRIAAAHRLEFRFAPGDIQFVNNYTVLHGRAAHAPVTDESQVRLLMRIWLDLPDSRPVVDDAIVRYGIVRHGNLGWTAAQVRAGEVGATRPRRADGATA
jgi:hypothetical protein